MSYQNRLNAFHKRRDWSLVSGAIAWSEDSGVTGRLEFAQIRQVRLRYEPTRTEKKRALLQLQTAGDCESISNIDYRGPLESIDQSEAFVAFAEELHEALAAAPGKVDFLGGWTARGYQRTLMLCAVILLTDLGLGAFLYFEGMPAKSAFTVLAILGLFASLLVLARRNRPYRYEPRAIPWNRVALAPVDSP